MGQLGAYISEGRQKFFECLNGEYEEVKKWETRSFIELWEFLDMSKKFKKNHENKSSIPQVEMNEEEVWKMLKR